MTAQTIPGALHVKPGARCRRKDCIGVGVALPVLVLRRADSPHAARVVCGLPHCAMHQAVTTLADLFDPKGWAALMKTWAANGWALPDEALTTVEWELLRASEPIKEA